MSSSRPAGRPDSSRRPAGPSVAWLAVAAVIVLAITGGVLGLRPGLGSAAPSPSPAPSPVALAPEPTRTPAPTVWTAPDGGWPAYSPLPTFGPVRTPTPTRNPDVAAGPNRRVATRVTVPDLRIDLPVMRQKSSYPACNVAMYLREFKQPGQGGPTYLYAHAQKGMFLPLLTQSKRRDGARMLGMQVFVYTGDNLRFEYEITRVRRHARDFRPVVAAKGETVWLQTSEGPNASYPKLQVAGKLVGSVEVTHEEAHPRPRPKRCG